MSRIGKLSPRYKQIADLITHGKSNKEIAAYLGLSPLTVQHHLHHIYGLTNCRNRTELAVTIERYNNAQLASLHPFPVPVVA